MFYYRFIDYPLNVILTCCAGCPLVPENPSVTCNKLVKRPYTDAPDRGLPPKRPCPDSPDAPRNSPYQFSREKDVIRQEKAKQFEQRSVAKAPRVAVAKKNDSVKRSPSPACAIQLQVPVKAEVSRLVSCQFSLMISNYRIDTASPCLFNSAFRYLYITSVFAR